MGPSKAKKKHGRTKTEFSSSPPPISKSVKPIISDAGEFEAVEDEGRRSLDWLISAFPSISVDQINSVNREAGGDPYKAAGILGSEFVDPGDGNGSSGRNKSARKKKRIAASTGMVSSVIGKDYWRSASTCGGRRGWGGPIEMKGLAICAYRCEEAEEFLCSMLGGDSELGMGVVRDVLCQCGYDLEKALEALLDISAFCCNQCKQIVDFDHIEVISGEPRKVVVRNSEIHPEMLCKGPSSALSSFQLTDKTSFSTYHSSAKEQDTLPNVGSRCRDYLKAPLSTRGKISSRSGMVSSDLQQEVLESLFNVTEVPHHEVKSLSWTKVVRQVESFGLGLEHNFVNAAEPLEECRSGKEDDYHVFRSVAKKNWESMKTYYHKAALAYSGGERAQASYLSEKGKIYKTLAHEADEKASQKIFDARNKSIKNTVTIDLHGQHVKQAIELLKLHLLVLAYTPSVHFLKVITGCGAYGVGMGKLKRAVLELAQKEGIKYSEENSGTLLLCLEGHSSFKFMESHIDSE